MKLRKKIIKWAKDRGIIQNSSIEVQTLKLVSEFGELSFSLNRGDGDIVDDVGDCSVVCTILVEMLGGDMAELNTRAMVVDDVEYLLEYLLDASTNLGNIADNVAKRRYDKALEYIYKFHLNLTQLVGEHFNECLKHAYNEIKDRKGYLNENGIFIKEGDV